MNLFFKAGVLLKILALIGLFQNIDTRQVEHMPLLAYNR